jgi:hypothetical protein
MQALLVSTRLSASRNIYTRVSCNCMKKKSRTNRDDNQSPKAKWGIRQWLGYGLLAVVAIHFLYVASKKTIQNFQLADRGILVKAFVAEKNSVGGKGTILFTLKYEVNGITYVNEFTNERWNTGDSVNVVVLKEDPMVMRSFRFISKNYSTSLKLK